ncbi:MAG: Glycosyl transferase family 2 [Candidatus Woesebacteria bacterium GW2011_GWA1_39_12]|uniref:Glycosyl transferase family 2 n=1 Tax=Candidatus Woesebacteria bacterium GW2011_GWA1_39_12 TaxID=1618549 RepID=A0A0G0PFW7_9BACT|nr:MAG: Glycosyl transferase family 2 [Candidatus Woesebacteria bacterium GW2011_GWA1_39_12]
MEQKTVSIIIATLNSENTLPLVFESIKKQTFPQKLIEVIVVDGGSTDRTLFIARKNRARVINNPRTEQNYGKHLGYLRARGRYIMFLDSDEILKNKNSLKIRTQIFNLDDPVKIIVGSGYTNPSGYPFVNKYINEFGDPFSFFIYRLSKDSKIFVGEMRKRYKIIEEAKNYAIFDLSGVGSLPILELTAGGSMIDAVFLKRNFPETKTRVDLLNHAFYLIFSKSSRLAIAKGDAIAHYSASNLSKYLNKISWRVKSNIHYVSSVGMSGFVGRDRFQSGKKTNYKKYLFIPYSFSLIGPIIDSTYLVITRGDMRYFLHFPLCIYTAGQIIYHSLLKVIGIKPKLLSYGGNELIRVKN